MEENSSDDVKLILTTSALSGISTYATDTACGNTIQAQTSSLLNRTVQSDVPTFVPITTIGLIGGLSSLLSIAESGMYGSAPASSEIYDKTNYSSVERNAKLIYDRFNKTHEVDESISGLIIPAPELAEKLDKILKSNDKNTLYEALTAIQEVLQEAEKQQNNEMKLEFKQK